MSFTSRFLALAAFALPSLAQAAPESRVDPETQIRYYLLESDEASSTTYRLGWGFDRWASAKIDFDRFEKDETYAVATLEKYENNLVQLVTENASGRVIGTFGASQTGRVCFETEFERSNHCYAKLVAKNETLASLEIAQKWSTAYVEILRFGKGENGRIEIVASSGNLVDIFTNDAYVAFDETFGAQSNYRRDRDQLTFWFSLKDVAMDQAALGLTFAVEAMVPKNIHDDSFEVDSFALNYQATMTPGFHRIALRRR